MYNFLLISSNLTALSPTVIEIQRLIDQKSQIFPTLLSFSALVWGDPFRISGKALRILKFFQAADSEDVVILDFRLIHPCDRRTDRIAMAKTD